MQIKSKGTFISFEGIDGSGKSTQIKKVRELLRNYNKNIIFTREPGGTKESELIRNLILKPNIDINFEDKTEILLLLAARYEHFKKLIQPEILKGSVIVCDRFIDSTLAYQCSNKALKDFYLYVSKELIYDFQPDLTILLDISPSDAIKRINNRKVKNRYDSKDLKYFQKVRKNYLELAKKNKKIIKLSASKNENILAEEIKEVILKSISQ